LLPFGQEMVRRGVLHWVQDLEERGRNGPCLTKGSSRQEPLSLGSGYCYVSCYLNKYVIVKMPAVCAFMQTALQEQQLIRTCLH